MRAFVCEYAENAAIFALVLTPTNNKKPRKLNVFEVCRGADEGT